MLDMLTDRCATMCLLVNLAVLYPSYIFLFQLSMSLDIASHWLHLHRYTHHCILSRPDMSNVWPVNRFYVACEKLPTRM